MATPNYAVDENDSRLVAVRDEEKAELTKSEQMYGGMIADTKDYYDDLKGEVDRYAKEQTDLQNKKTDFTIDKIEQQKEQTRKDYLKEQSGAYTDWQKESNRYGVNAERQAAAGMAGTGYSESSQVNIYNTYQNRVATARESYERSKLEYENGMREARLQNDVLLAEIQHNALQKKLELSLEGFQYKNQLLLDQAAKRLEIKNAYFTRYKATLDQINTENALAEEVRQYNETMAFQKQQAAAEQAKIAKYSRTGTGKNPIKTNGYAKTLVDKDGNTKTIKIGTSANEGAYKGSHKNLPFDGRTYEAAKKYLNENGLLSADLVDESTWNKQKQQYIFSQGRKFAANGKYSSYQDYLKNYVAFKLASV